MLTGVGDRSQAFGAAPSVSDNQIMGRVRSAAAGAVAAAVWAAQEPFDQRVFGCDYSDVALLGKLLTRDDGWLMTGLRLHLANGAIFGLVYHEVRERVAVEPRRLAIGMALLEHVSLYPLCHLIDLHHPRRGEPGIPPLLKNGRAFAQATWRHALFGWVLGRLA